MSDILGPQLPKGYVPKKLKGDFWEGLGIGSYEAANSALLGLPDFIVSKTDAKKAIDELRERNKEAALAGNVVGTVGSMFIPGGAIAKGLGAGAKALGAAKLGAGLTKAGKFISTADKTGKFLPSAIKGVAGAAEQAVPRALLQAGTDGDIEKSGQDLATSLALGGGIGGVLGKAGGLLKKGASAGADIIEDAAEGAERAYLGSMGITPRVIRQDMGRNVVGGLKRSNKLSSAEELNRKNLIDFAKKYGMEKGAGRDKRVEGALKEIGKKYDDAITSAVNKDPALTQTIMQNVAGKVQAGNYADDVQQEVQGLIGKYANDPKGITGLRNKLSDDISRAKRATALTSKDVEKLEALESLSDELADAIDEASGGTIKQIGKEYRAGKQFQQASFMDNAKGYAAPSGGSATQARQATEKFAGNILGGVGLGGASAASDISQGEDIDLGKMATAGLIGGIGGTAANTLIPKLIQKGTGATAGVLGKLSGKIDDLAGKGGINIDPNIGQNIAKLPGSVVGSGLGEQEPEAVEASTDAEQAVQSTPGELNPQLQQKIQSRLETIYNNEFADQMSPEEFMEWANTKTKGFTDKASLGVILYDDPKQAKEYADKVKLAEQFQAINLEKALSDGWFDDEADSQKKALTELLMNQQTGGDVSKRSEGQKKILAEQLSLAKKNPEMLPQILANYGLDFAELKELGVI